MIEESGTKKSGSTSETLSQQLSRGNLYGGNEDRQTGVIGRGLIADRRRRAKTEFAHEESRSVAENW
jgi:hypothetical protein